MKNTILIAEDNADMSSFYVDVLRDMFPEGTRIEAFPDGGALVARLDEPGLLDCAYFVLTDMDMPVMNGLRVIGEVRRRNRTVPIYMLADQSEEVGRVAVAAGATGFYRKTDGLVETLRAIAKRAEMP